jgi:1,4-alpha-glucan branching enzyme
VSLKASKRGRLAILLHTHMPYVEGFGTWPFGEEWLWEAIAVSYLPLLELLEQGAPLTLSLTPVLCDQLEAPGVSDRFQRFVAQVRSHTHAEDAAGLRAGGHELLARELERCFEEDYRTAAERLEALDGDLLGALAPHAQWTSSATHAVLPLLASDATLRAQIQTGVASHRSRFPERWRGGFWLPECAYASHLEPLLAQAGARAVCVELTGRFGLGAREHLQPLRSTNGLVLVPIDRATMALVWSDQGYPSHGRYRDYHRHTVHHHNPWANDGGAYDHERALVQAREDARDFVARTRARLERDGQGVPGGGLAVCALDTELLGHWWYEGISWLRAVLEECSAQGLELVRLDDALAEHELPALEERAAELGESSWGAGGDLSTWSGPAVADMAFGLRAAELELLGAPGPPNVAALRELLALQASDWAFMVSRGLAVPYARERFEGHRAALRAALKDGSATAPGSLGRLAVHADPAMLQRP